MPSMVTGSRSTASDNGTYRKRLDISDKIIMLEDKVELTKVVDKLKKDKATREWFGWNTDQFRPKTDTYSGSTEGGAPSRDAVTDNATFTNSYFAVGDIIWNLTTTERMRIQGSGSVSGYKLRRGVGSIAPSVMTNGDTFLQLVRVYGQGKSLYGAKMTKVDTQYNFIQLNREHFDITGTANSLSENGGQYGPTERNQQRMMIMGLVARQANHSMHFGEAHALQTIASPTVLDEDGDPISTTNGFHINVPTANKNTSAYTGMTLADLDNITLPMFRYSGNGTGGEKFAFVSREIGGIISRLASSAQRIAPSDNKYGVWITRIQLGHGGILNLVQDTTLENGPAAAGAPKRTMFVMDQTDCGIHEARPMNMLVDRKPTGSSDKIIDEVEWEWGLKFGLPLRHGLANNISG